MADTHEKKEEKKDDHAKPKKTFGQVLVTIIVSLLFFALFVIGANALLGMIFPSITQSVQIIGQGLQGTGTELIRTNVSLGIFMSALFGFLIRFLIIVLGLALTAKMGMAIGDWLRPAPAGAHP